MSKVCKEAEEKALMMMLKEQFEALNIPREVVMFDTDMADLRL